MYLRLHSDVIWIFKKGRKRTWHSMLLKPADLRVKFNGTVTNNLSIEICVLLNSQRIYKVHGFRTIL